MLARAVAILLLSVPALAVLHAKVVASAQGAAHGSNVRFLGREEPLDAQRELAGAARVLPPRRAPLRFNLIGVHWTGPGTVWLRAQGADGHWGAWLPAAPEGEDLPDEGTAERRARAGWRLGNPHWTGPAERVQYRIAGRIGRLRAYFLWSEPQPARALAVAGTPFIAPRAAWGADEAITRPAYYAPGVRFAVVHHTAGRDEYSPQESGAIVRGIQEYHVRANGWNDIGYNFLVDRYGQVFEGRAGGVDRNVVGAHAQGFNTGSVGVAVLGSYDAEVPTPEALAALAALLAWRLDVAHVDPLSVVGAVSGGNPRYAAGAEVLLRAVSGHRDAGSTLCPGAALYGELFGIAQAAAGLGLPKLYEPAVEPAWLDPRVDGTYDPVHLHARLSAPLPWTVTVTDPTGAVIASGAGTGDLADWTWDGRGPDGAPVAPGRAYLATIAAGPETRPAEIVLAALAPVELESLTARPATLTPNGDGNADETRISFQLSAAASVSVSLVDGAGQAMATLLPEAALAPGPAKLLWNGSAPDGTPLPDGSYRIAVSARGASGTVVTRDVPVVLDRVLGSLRVERAGFSPNGDGRLDALALSFDLAREARVRVTIRRRGRELATVLDSVLPAGRQAVSWNGALPGGRVPDGAYLAVAEATTDLGTRLLARRFTVDTSPPRLAVLSTRSRRGATKVVFSLSEPARVKVWTDAGASAIARPAGVSGFWQRVVTTRLRLVAWDAAGNASVPVRVSVRR